MGLEAHLTDWYTAVDPDRGGWVRYALRNSREGRSVGSPAVGPFASPGKGYGRAGQGPVAARQGVGGWGDCPLFRGAFSWVSWTSGSAWPRLRVLSSIKPFFTFECGPGDTPWKTSRVRVT